MIRLSALGDVLFTLPAIDALRRQFPQAHVAFLVSRRCAPLLSGFSGVNETIVWDPEAFRRGRVQGWWRNTFALAARLRRARFDLVLDLHGFGETALFTTITCARERWGLLKSASWRRLAYTRVVLRRRDRHPVDEHLNVLQTGRIPTAGARNQFVLPAVDLEKARVLLGELGVESHQPFIFIQPLTSDPKKNVPFDKLLAFARHWRGLGIQVLFGGGPGDRVFLSDRLRHEFPTSAGADLLCTAGLIQLSQLVVGADTGMIHLAVALGRRAVVMMNVRGPQSPIPYGHPEWVLPLSAGATVADIPVEQIIAVTDRALHEVGAPPLRQNYS